MALKIGKIKRKPGIAWVGSFYAHSNFGKINRYIAQHLLQTGEYELGFHPDDEHNQIPGILSPVVESRLKRVPSILEYQIFHQQLPQLEPPQAGKWILMQPWEYGSMPLTWQEHMKFSVDDIWVYSQYNKECYMREGIDANRLAVIPPGVDPEIFNPQAIPARLPTTKGFKFLFVGETLWYSGIDLLLNAFIEEFLPEENVTLIIKDSKSASPTARQANIEMIRQYQQNPDNPEIVYIDRDMSPEEMAGLYRACDCLVYPYRSETFGLAILEAMACGLPTIVTQWGDALDFCDEERNTFISARQIKHINKEIGGFETVSYPYWSEPNPIELRFRMRDTQENYDQAQQKGICASEYVLENYTWKHTADKIIERLEELKDRPLYRFYQGELQAKILKGLDAFEKNQYQEALTQLNMVLEEEPDNPVIHMDIGTIYMKQEAYEQAIQHFEKALHKDPANANLYSVMGISLFHLQEHALSAKFFDKALQLNPDHGGARQSAITVQQIIRNKPRKKRDRISEKYKPLEELLSLIHTRPRRQTLALCMIVKNEERFLQQCIESVRDIVDEIVILDTGSTDKTVEIAEENGADVYSFEWTGSFSDARNEALTHVKSDWVLILDADEVVAPNTRHNIRELIDVPQPQLTGYQLKIRNFNQPGNEVDVVEHYTLRLFPNTPELTYKGVIHEQVLPRDENTTFERLASPDVLLWHYGYTGEMMDEREKHQRNLEMLERAIADEPNNPFHYFNLGLTHRISKEEDEKALEAFLKCKELAEQHEHLPTYMSAAYSYIASVYLSLDKPAEAIKVCEDAPEMCHNNPDFWVNFGSAYNGVGEYEKAVDCFKRAMELRCHAFTSLVCDRASTTWKPYAGMGNTYLFMKDLEKASFYFRRAMRENPKNPEIKLGVARLETFRGNFESAEKYYQELLAESHEALETIIRSELANIYFKQDRIQKATEIIGPVKDSRDITTAIANIYFKAGKYEDMLELFNGLVESGSAEAEDYRNRGIAYYKLEQYDAAKGDFEKALTIDENDAEALHNLGAIALSNEDVVTAESYYQRAIAADPELFGSYYDMGKIRTHQENFEEAREYLYKAYEINPKHVEMLRLLANVEQILGNLGDACERFLDITDIEPENSEVLTQLGFILTNCGEYDRALQVFEKALAFDDKNTGIYSGIGITFLQMERYEDARNSFLLAYQLDPTDDEVQKGLQMADALSGQTPLPVG